MAISELLGLSVLEAMPSGTPVASRTGGVPEVIVDGETGFLWSRATWRRCTTG